VKSAPSIGQLLRSVLGLKCPICLRGRVFQGLFDARDNCEICGFFFSRESGYFLGSVYFGYLVTLAGAIPLWLVLSQALGLGWDWRVLAVLLAFVASFPIWFFRYSRMLWMALDLYLNPPVREDFEPRGRSGGT
jgi:uncharacterized protein (DUF983 family)